MKFYFIIGTKLDIKQNDIKRNWTVKLKIMLILNRKHGFLFCIYDWFSYWLRGCGRCFYDCPQIFGVRFCDKSLSTEFLGKVCLCMKNFVSVQYNLVWTKWSSRVLQSNNSSILRSKLVQSYFGILSLWISNWPGVDDV